MELWTGLALHCSKKSIKETLCSYRYECRGDIVSSTGPSIAQLSLGVDQERYYPIQNYPNQQTSIPTNQQINNDQSTWKTFKQQNK